jgi:xylulokinase
VAAIADAVVGIDLGTSVVKVGIYTFDGVMQATVSQAVAITRRDGRVEQDLGQFYDSAAAATRACLAGSKFPAERVAAMAVTGQMAGIGIVDARHRPLAPFDSWLDSRCAEIVAEITDELGRRVAGTAGCAPTVSIGPKMAWWQRHDPGLCKRAASFVTAGGFVAARAAGLPGSQAFIDSSYLHFTSVADTARGQWDDLLVEAVGVNPDLLPVITDSTAIVGGLTRQAAEDFGLPAGTPIAAGCGDTAGSLLGAGVTEPGQAFDIAGTAAVFGVCLPVFAPDASAGATLMTMRAPLPGRWYSLAYVGGAGQVIEWLCREILGHDRVTDAAYEDLAAVAATAAPGSGGLVVSPHFAGRVAPTAPDTRGAVVGLSPAHSRAHIARAALESIAFEYRRYAEAAQVLAPQWPAEEITGIGGGSRLGTWNQIKADVLGKPYRQVLGVDPGTRGAALIALAAIGHELPELKPATLGAPVRPDTTAYPAYAAAYARYRAWSERLDDAFRQDASQRAI